ncbi:exopolyphosphatase [Aliiglaciecola sp. 3_MG-2023]|uniref:exopolyphosphatase n=1 Tax=Aliiglaciecola sp. 3_MG-2023 TaxID=3062644 RepID=UPI0026E24A63|nr:exopolyphosphatase [Aliiglaciecola sp. 3_MG-2023]MDO6692761.1 exopolyphosphatase [Aliiglaciecola sp. 3_MG-2023]
MSELSEAFSNIEARPTTQVAALDIGSNSFHLVVARIVAGSVQILHRVKQKVRLADGLDKHNRLSDEAMQRGLDTLQIIAESLKGFEPDTVRIVATYTLRKAKNAKEFIQAAKQILPYPIEVISGIEEARLIYSGVAHTVQNDGQRLVVDIGGGSTEFIIGEGFESKIMRSLQMGCVSYTKRFFANGSLSSGAFKKAVTAAQQELELIDAKYIKLGWRHCIGTSGTIKAIVLLAQSLDDANPEGFVSLDDLKALRDKCISAGHIKDLKLAVTEDRVPVLAAGISILIGIFKSLKITTMEYSAAALREGVLYEMEEQLAHHDIRERTAQSLATRYDVDVDQAKRVHVTTLAVYNQCKKAWKIGGQQYRNLLSWAALLHEVGLQINSRGVQRHSGYILQNVDLHGFNQEQQVLLSVLTRFHRKKLRPDELPEFWQFDSEVVKKLIVILRLGVLLNIKRQDDFLPDFAVVVDDKSIQITFPEQWLLHKPIISADLAREAEYLSVLNYKLAFS